MRSIEYLLKRKEEIGMSYEEMAKKAGMSPAAWYVLIKRGKAPTLTRAKQLTQILDMDEPDNFINVVFKDRLVEFLEKQTNNNKDLTSQIRKIIQSIKTWRPDRGEGLDILCQLASIPSQTLARGLPQDTTVPPFLRSMLCQKCLTSIVRDGVSEPDPK